MASTLSQKVLDRGILELVHALGSSYTLRHNDPEQADASVTWRELHRILGEAFAYGLFAEVKDVPGSKRWYIEVHNGNGRAYGQYHFNGH